MSSLPTLIRPRHSSAIFSTVGASARDAPLLGQRGASALAHDTRRLPVRAQKGDAAGAAGEVLVERGVVFRRELLLQVVGEERDGFLAVLHDSPTSLPR